LLDKEMASNTKKKRGNVNEKEWIERLTKKEEKKEY